jgi:hypothetical protein
LEKKISKPALPGVLLISMGMAALVAHTNAIQNHASGKIDKTIIREVDLTRDGKPERIVLHITGDNMRSPFSWTFEIISNGRRIFQQEDHDTAGFDSLFDPNDDFLMEEMDCKCYSYESCKKRWYFDEVPRRFIARLDAEDAEWLKKTETETSPPFHPFSEIYDRILATGRATASEAERIIEDLKIHMESGDAFGIDMEVHPGGYIAVWIPVIDDFFVIFEPS